jgi:hypothetical protein
MAMSYPFFGNPLASLAMPPAMAAAVQSVQSAQSTSSSSPANEDKKRSGKKSAVSPVISNICHDSPPLTQFSFICFFLPPGSTFDGFGSRSTASFTGHDQQLRHGDDNQQPQQQHHQQRDKSSKPNRQRQTLGAGCQLADWEAQHITVDDLVGRGATESLDESQRGAVASADLVVVFVGHFVFIHVQL